MTIVAPSTEQSAAGHSLTLLHPLVVHPLREAARRWALEKIKAAAAAAQAAEIVSFARAQVAEQQSAGVDYRRLGRGIGDQVGMATRTGPWQGARKLTIARDLWHELPGCFGLLAAGEISEHVAALLVGETSHLDQDTRRVVDVQLVAARVDRMAPKTAAGTARRLAHAADPQGSMHRARTARKDRRVSLRPLPDTMAGLSAFLPVEQGVACWAALKAAVDALKAVGDPRTRGQIAADTLVERLTGQTSAGDVDVEVNIMVRWRTCSTPSARDRARCPGSGRSRPGWPMRSSAAAEAGGGGGDCSPPPPATTMAASSWVGIRPRAGSPAGWRN